MATNTARTPVTISHIDREDWDGEEVASGQHVSYGALGFAREQFGALSDNHPSFGEWEKVLDEVFEEVHPQIRDLFYEALQRRLPWTWEPER